MALEQRRSDRQSSGKNNNSELNNANDKDENVHLSPVWDTENISDKKKRLISSARSRCLKEFCLILLIMSSKRQIGRARVFHLQNHGHKTLKMIFQLCK